MKYFFIILKIYTILIKRLKRSFTGLFILLNSMDNFNITGQNSGSNDPLYLKYRELEEGRSNEEDIDGYTPQQLEELELENFLLRESDATLDFKEKLEEYVYNNFLPFLRYFNMSRLRDMFL